MLVAVLDRLVHVIVGMAYGSVKVVDVSMVVMEIVVAVHMAVGKYALGVDVVMSFGHGQSDTDRCQ